MKKAGYFIRLLIIASFLSLFNGPLVFDTEAAVRRTRTVSRGGHTRSRTVVHHGGGGAVHHNRHHRRVVRHRRMTMLPSGCRRIYSGGALYHHCGTIYYQPYYEGSSVVYVVVDYP